MEMEKEDVDRWNAVFTNCQIRLSDLSNPTTGFLTKVFVAYLKRFGYKVEAPFTMENYENRLFRIKLAKQIDHMLKISNEKYAFTYLDLIMPTKKTGHILCILLNYLFYYNMYKEDIFKMVGKPINDLQELKTRVEETRSKNESGEKENADLKESIQIFEGRLSLCREELKAWIEKANARKENICKLEGEIEGLIEKKERLRREKSLLLKQVVSDKEFRELEKQSQQLQNKLTTLVGEQENIESVLGKRHEDTKKLEKQTCDLEELNKIFPEDLLKQLLNISKQLKNLQREAQRLENEDKLSQRTISELTEAIELFQAEYNEKKREFGIKRLNIEKKITEQQHIIEKSCKIKNELVERENNLECRLAEQRHIEQIIDESIVELMK
uniref:Uncharacterized protein n=1 Tax=Glossina brevipalpis TaxID=37001 RepID=A0A1A9WZX3_9MUSC